MDNLEQQLNEECNNLSIPIYRKNMIKSYLKEIKKVDIITYEHSLRVGLLGSKLAKLLSLDPKPLFYSGLLHDLGKVLIPELLTKKIFNLEDMQKMKKHPILSYILLFESHPFSARIALRHHCFQKDPYPNDLTKDEEAEQYAKLLSAIDFYDAIMNRENNKFGKYKKFDKEEAVLKLEEDKPFLEIKTIKSLYSIA